MLSRYWEGAYIAVIGAILCDVAKDSIVCDEILNLPNGWGPGLDAFWAAIILDIPVHSMDVYAVEKKGRYTNASRGQTLDLI